MTSVIPTIRPIVKSKPGGLPNLSQLVIGELGTKRNEDVRNSVSTAKISYSAEGVSQFEFSVSDPDLAFQNNGYFVIRRQVRYLGTVYEIAAVEVNGEEKNPASVDVTCRTEAIQKIKRDKGAANFGKISPTSFAASIAAKHKLDFFGEPSSAKEAIVRTQNEKTDESSWDVLSRLANELEFEMFEAKGILFFSSQKFLLTKQPHVTVFWPPEESSSMPMHSFSTRRSDDDPLGATIDAKLDRTNGKLLVPGMGLRLRGVAFYEEPFMITSVSWDEGSNKPVSIKGNTLQDSPDTGCETKTFKKGSTDICVNRIQQAMGQKATRNFDAALEKAVRAFQQAQGLKVDGIVGPATWAKIRANL